jgi:hypothetical protein
MPHPQPPEHASRGAEMLKCVHSETNFDLRALAMTASISATIVDFFAEDEPFLPDTKGNAEHG